MIVDLFAGMGGWDFGAHALGLQPPIGVENWDKARATRDAISELMPMETWSNGDGHNGVYAWLESWSRDLPDPIEGLIASPPCQAWSQAGNRKSLEDQGAVLEIIESGDFTPHEWRNHGWEEETTPLILVPWWAVMSFEPEWVTFEQVTPVLPVWEEMARAFEGRGYSTWTGVLDARDYGVPQRRKRAILVASRTKHVGEPPATHVDPSAIPSLFDRELPHWVSMRECFQAEGLDGWGEPMAVGFPRRDDGQEEPTDDGYRARDFFTSEEPSQTVTSHSRSWHKRGTHLVPGSWGDGRRGGHRRQYDSETESAPTLAFGKDMYAWRWLQTGRDWKPDGTSQEISAEAPGPTLTHQSRSWKWADGPATAVMGDPRLWPPGHKVNQTDIDNLGEVEAKRRYGDRKGTDALRLTIEEALVLQSFPSNVPLMGKSKRGDFTMVGNAVPPLMAMHILKEATGI